MEKNILLCNLSLETLVDVKIPYSFRIVYAQSVRGTLESFRHISVYRIFRIEYKYYMYKINIEHVYVCTRWNRN